MNHYICPVCAYPRLTAPPQDFTICPCCGTEFGLDDFAADVEAAWKELRWRWVENGAHWFDPGTAQPLGWNGYRQALASPLVVALQDTLAETQRSTLVLPGRVQYAA